MTRSSDIDPEVAAAPAESGAAFPKGRAQGPGSGQGSGQDWRDAWAAALARRASAAWVAVGGRVDRSAAAAGRAWEDAKASDFSTLRRRSAILAVALAVAGPVLAISTYAILSTSDQEALASGWFRALIAADVAYLVVLIGLIGVQISRVMAARRARSAGARLHARMATVFAGVAAAPTIVVAVFFFLVMHLGFQAWFSQQVSEVVQNSRTVARAYVAEHREAMAGRTMALARQLAAQTNELIGGVRDRRFPQLFARLTEDATLTNIYVIDGDGGIIARCETCFLWGYAPPEREDFERAQSGVMVIDQASGGDEIRALLRLESNAYLFATREVSRDVLNAFTRTEQGVDAYTRLEENRGVWLAQFAALYLGFAVLVLLAAIYFGLWFAERLSRPIARLSEAAQRVGEGDLTARVKEERSEDDLAVLSRAFNKMTDEVRRKQEALTEANAESEQRRQFSEAVVLGVPAGVVGLDGRQRVQVINTAAAQLLRIDADAAIGQPFAALAPEFADLLEDARYETLSGVERQIRITRDDVEHELLARAATQRASAGDARGVATGATAFESVMVAGGPVSGFVVTIDDLTDLNSAQRLAAWGDVARRVAHEIKNPLTPIQLSAERLRRKYAKRLGDEAENFERYVETIVRQTEDIGRMVDAFSRFARMPAPKMAEQRLDGVVREAVLLQEEGRAHIRYALEIADDDQGWRLRCDRGQISQALTNLLTNASDAIEGRLEEDAAAGREGAPPEVRVSLHLQDDGPRGRRAVICIEDNGVGLPVKDRRRLLEPYVTTRAKGTGLGLAIVSKIIEEHKGAVELTDATPFAEDARPGAAARIILPLLQVEETASSIVQAEAMGAKTAVDPGSSAAAEGSDALRMDATLTEEPAGASDAEGASLQKPTAAEPAN
ncbi:MAG: PAS domain-containing sensor histidine kinase [Pseudomonadota bacterium]